MLDINDIRSRREELKVAVQNKHKNVDVDKVITLDDQRKALQYQIDQTKSKQKQAWNAKDITTATSLKETIRKLEQEYQNVIEEYNKLMLELPNFIHPEVPVGKDENENQIVYEYGIKPNFMFEVQDHQTLGEKLDILDKQKATDVTGARFYYVKGELAQLQYALVQFTFDVLTNETILKNIIKKKWLNISSKTFTIIIPPVIINQDTANKMWRLHPKEDRYCIEEDNFMFVWSAEHSLGPIHMNDTIPEEMLPLRYVAYTPCFRREAWTYGKDTRGVFRNHQFDKIEMETFTSKEEGEQEQEFIVWIQQYLVEQLNIPYQLLTICTGDMWSNDYRQFDINCYMPWQWKYRETHTSDYMTDYQARRLNTKIVKKDWTKEYAHMNDATAMAFPRLWIALIENNQQEDGTIKIPEILRPYMKGKRYIGK